MMWISLPCSIDQRTAHFNVERPSRLALGGSAYLCESDRPSITSKLGQVKACRAAYEADSPANSLVGGARPLHIAGREGLCRSLASTRDDIWKQASSQRADHRYKIPVNIFRLAGTSLTTLRFDVGVHLVLTSDKSRLASVIDDQQQDDHVRRRVTDEEYRWKQ